MIENKFKEGEVVFAKVNPTLSFVEHLLLHSTGTQRLQSFSIEKLFFLVSNIIEALEAVQHLELTNRKDCR